MLRSPEPIGVTRRRDCGPSGGVPLACSAVTDANVLSQNRSGGGDPLGDVYQQLLKNRIVFLGSEVSDVSANLVCAQLLLLAAEDADRDINLYINSPGGSVTSGLAVYDTMQLIPCDVSTTCMGLAASMGQFLLCAGTPGKRFALPHSRILMHLSLIHI